VRRFSNKKKYGELLLSNFCTRAKGDKTPMKQFPWLSGLDTHLSPEFQGFNPY
jgi:hypothetical protein